MVSSTKLSTLFFLWLISASVVITQTPKDITAKFEYELKLSVDANKCAAYLKKMNEQPSSYEKVFTVFSGKVQVANVVDQVKFTGTTYQITSIGNLTAGMSTVLGGQRLVRESQGSVSPAGIVSSVYQA